MDTSETYIKMCEKAERCAPELFYKSLFNVHDYTFKVEGNDLLWWLPRQDELQEMAGNNKPFWKVLQDFLFWFSANLEIQAVAAIKEWTGEQLWLAFLFAEKYNKYWDGENWITQ